MASELDFLKDNFRVFGGLKGGTSSSPTDIWFMENMKKTPECVASGSEDILIYDDPSEEDGVVPGCNFVMKLFPTKDFAFKALERFSAAGAGVGVFQKKPLKNEGISLRNSSVFEALDYEIEVYEEVLNKLINTGICSNFIKLVPTVSSGGKKVKHRLTYDEMLEFLIQSKDITPTELETNFVNNIFHLIFNVDSDYDIPSSRTSIFEHGLKKTGTLFDTLSEFNEFKDFVKAHGVFNFIITEATLSKPVMSLTEMVLKEGHSKHEVSIAEAKTLVFQAFCACYALNRIGVAHNDIHPGNVLVEIDPPEETRTVTYRICGDDDDDEGLDVSFKTRFTVKVFDFDRSYSLFIRDGKGNPFLRDDVLCQSHHSCNNIFSKIKGIKKEDRVKMFNKTNMIMLGAWLAQCRKVKVGNDSGCAVGAIVGKFKAGVRKFVIESLANDSSDDMHKKAKADVSALFTRSCISNDSATFMNFDYNLSESETTGDEKVFYILGKRVLIVHDDDSEVESKIQISTAVLSEDSEIDGGDDDATLARYLLGYNSKVDPSLKFFELIKPNRIVLNKKLYGFPMFKDTAENVLISMAEGISTVKGCGDEEMSITAS